MAELLKIKIIGTVLAYRCATSWSFAHGRIMGVPMGVIRALGILQTPKLSYHCADSLQSSLKPSCRCATPWSFAHGCIMGMPVRMLRAPGIFRTLQPHNHWTDSLQIKFIGTVLACKHAASWLFAHQDPMGAINTLGTLFTGRGTLQWSACLFQWGEHEPLHNVWGW